MDSAPRDGSRILWCADNGEYTRQRWTYSVIRWPEYDDCFDAGWWKPLHPPSSGEEAHGAEVAR